MFNILVCFQKKVDIRVDVSIFIEDTADYINSEKSFKYYYTAIIKILIYNAILHMDWRTIIVLN